MKTADPVSENSGFSGESGQVISDEENSGTEGSGNNDFSSGEDAFGADGSDSYGSSDGGTYDSGEDSSEDITFDNSYENNENGSFSGDESGVDAQSFGGQPEFVQQSYVRTVGLSDTDVFRDSDAFSDSESGISDDGSSSADVQSDSGEEWNEYSEPDTSDNVFLYRIQMRPVWIPTLFSTPSAISQMRKKQEHRQIRTYISRGENIDQYPELQNIQLSVILVM